MKNSLKKLVLVIGCLFWFGAYGQQINIGDECPDVTLSVINYKKPSVKISDFRGQLLIIDFWATWCNPCVRMIPETDTLQKQFEGSATILPVTYEDEKTVRAFYAGYNKSRHILPYSAVGDAEMKRLFKPNEFPHYIWINGDGKVIAITGYEEITWQNILNAVNGTNPKLKQKRLAYNFDATRPFFSVETPIIDSGGVKRLDIVPSDSMLYHTVLTKYRPRFKATMHLGDSTRISAFNFTIKALYKSCLGKFQFPYLWDNLVSVETKDSLLVQCKLQGTPFMEWLSKHSYCYELVVPPALAAQRTEIMTEDLNRYFGPALGIEGVMEKRITKCMVLTRTTADDRIGSTDTGKYESQSTRYHYKMRNGHIYLFMNDLMMDFQTIKTPLVDDTGYKGKINLELNCNMHDMNEVNQALEKYGLKFVEKDYPESFVVIRDIPKSSAE